MKTKPFASFACLTLFAMLLTGCISAISGNVSISNGKDSDASVKKEIKVPAFNEIQASQGIKVIVAQGRFPGTVDVATTPSAAEFLQVKVSEGTLKLYYDFPAKANKKLKAPSIVTVTIPQLKEADLSSGAYLKLKGNFSYDSKMEFDLSSGAVLSIENLTCRLLSLDTSSGSNVTVENLTGDLDADSSSGSSISVKEAFGGVFTVDASSGSDISLKSNKSEEIRANASSGASISLSGRSERLSKQTSSGGSVNASNLSNAR